MLRKVAVFSGHRAERGHVDAIKQAIDADPRLAGVLLEFTPPAHDSTLAGAAASMVESMGMLVGTLVDLDPNILVVYGDRQEAFAAVVAGLQLGIAVAHVEGGDITEGGCPDDNLRYAASTLAHIHFATNDTSAERLRAMGEEPSRVHVVGLPILDLVGAGAYTQPAELSERYGLDLALPIIVFCQHPTPIEQTALPAIVALNRAMQRHAAQVIAIRPNGDPGSNWINGELDWFANQAHGWQVHANLPREDYHGLLAIAAAVVGNSSAGLKEAPALGCPCINIGDRQRGRLHGLGVTNVPQTARAIGKALEAAITSTRPRARFDNPYALVDSGKRIAEVLATVELGETLLQKKRAA